MLEAFAYDGPKGSCDLRTYRLKALIVLNFLAWCVTMGCLPVRGSSIFIFFIPLLTTLLTYFSTSREGAVKLTWTLIVAVACMVLLWFSREHLYFYYIGKSERLAYTSSSEAKLAFFQAKRYGVHCNNDYSREVRVLMLLGELDKAAEIVFKAENLVSNNIKYELARLSDEAHDKPAALKLYNSILKDEPYHSEANYCMAMHIDMEMRDSKSAAAYLRRAMVNLPPGSEWYNRCQNLLFDLEK